MICLLFLFQKESFFYFCLFKKEIISIYYLYEEEGITKTVDCRFPGGLTVEVYPRELMLPVDSNKIITVPGVRRCGKSSLFLLVINQLISEKGIRKEQILFLNFDDERLQFDAENFDEILRLIGNYILIFP